MEKKAMTKEEFIQIARGKGWEESDIQNEIAEDEKLSDEIRSAAYYMASLIVVPDPPRIIPRINKS
jgi:hypothetical protein